MRFGLADGAAVAGGKISFPAYPSERRDQASLPIPAASRYCNGVTQLRTPILAQRQL
jgi:hypothetical protein